MKHTTRRLLLKTAMWATIVLAAAAFVLALFFIFPVIIPAIILGSGAAAVGAALLTALASPIVFASLFASLMLLASSILTFAFTPDQKQAEIKDRRDALVKNYHAQVKAHREEQIADCRAKADPILALQGELTEATAAQEEAITRTKRTQVARRAARANEILKVLPAISEADTDEAEDSIVVAEAEAQIEAAPATATTPPRSQRTVIYSQSPRSAPLTNSALHRRHSDSRATSPASSAELDASPPALAAASTTLAAPDALAAVRLTPPLPTATIAVDRTAQGVRTILEKAVEDGRADLYREYGFNIDMKLKNLLTQATATSQNTEDDCSDECELHGWH